MTSALARVVVVDANTIVHGPWRLESAAWRVLLHQARTAQVELIVPDLVVREAVGRFRGELHSRFAGLRTAAERMGDLTGAAPEIPPVDLDAEVARYEEQIRAALADAGAKVVDLPNIDLVALTQDAIDRRRPFNDKGSGFRDALLWRLVRNVVEERPACFLALVSKDARAFGMTKALPQLHPDLAADLASCNFIGSFTLFDSIAAYLDSSGVPDPHLTALVLETAQEQESSLSGMASANLVPADVATPWPGISARVTAAEDVQVQLLRVVGSGEGLVLAHLVVTATVHIEIAFEDYAAPFLHAAIARVAVTGTASFDTSERKFGDFALVLPVANTVPEVVEVVARVDPARLMRSELSSEVLEQFRRATEFKLPPEVLEQFRRATEFKLPPEVLEQFRRATEFKLPPEVLEQFRRATEFKLPPEVLEQFRRATEFKLPPEVLEQFRRADQGFGSPVTPAEVDPTAADDDLAPQVGDDTGESEENDSRPTTKKDASTEQGGLHGRTAEASSRDENGQNTADGDESAPDEETS